jgi:hypothetical protein
VRLRRLGGVMHGVKMVSVRDVGVMGRLERLARLMVFRSLKVVVSGTLVMLSRLLVVIDVVLRINPARFSSRGPEASSHHSEGWMKPRPSN